MNPAPLWRSRLAARTVAPTRPLPELAARRVANATACRTVSTTRATLKPATSTAGPSSSSSSSSWSPSPPPHTSGPTSSSPSYNALPKTSSDDKVSRVTWASGIESRYHHMWLRDHCRCPTCYHPKTKQRLLNTFAIPADVHPISTEATMEGLRITWPPLPAPAPAEESASETPRAPQQSQSDADHVSSEIFESPDSQPHVSLYPWRWLRTNSYAPPLDQPQLHSISGGEDDFIGLGKTLWGKGIESRPPTVAYEEIMAGDEGVWKWLEKIVSARDALSGERAE